MNGNEDGNGNGNGNDAKRANVHKKAPLQIANTQ
jgi:hypothetical protein